MAIMAIIFMSGCVYFIQQLEVQFVYCFSKYLCCFKSSVSVCNVLNVILLLNIY